MSWVIVAVAGTAALGAAVNSNSAAHASTDQHTAAAEANAIQQGQYNQQRQDSEAYRQSSERALGQLNEQMPDLNRSFSAADFRADPGYQFRMDEGMKAIERSAAARGGRHGTSTMKAMTRFGQETANSAYQQSYDNFNADRSNRFNRLASLVGIGQTANAQTSQAGQNMANNVSANTLAAGNASAANSIAQGNAINSGIGQGANTWLQYQMMNRQPAVTPSTSPNYGSAGSSYGNYSNLA